MQTAKIVVIVRTCNKDMIDFIKDLNIEHVYISSREFKNLLFLVKKEYIPANRTMQAFITTPDMATAMVSQGTGIDFIKLFGERLIVDLVCSEEDFNSVKFRSNLVPTNDIDINTAIDFTKVWHTKAHASIAEAIVKYEVKK